MEAVTAKRFASPGTEKSTENNNHVKEKNWAQRQCDGTFESNDIHSKSLRKSARKDKLATSQDDLKEASRCVSLVVRWSVCFVFGINRCFADWRIYVLTPLPETSAHAHTSQFAGFHHMAAAAPAARPWSAIEI